MMEMNWTELEKSLRSDVERLQAEQLKIPASSVASVTAIGCAALVLGLLANAVAAGHSKGADQ